MAMARPGLATMSTAALALDQVCFTYPGWAPVVDRIDWTIPGGEFHCLVGRSGCGKTSLLKIAAGLLRPDSGRVQRPGSSQVGFVFQSPTLLDWLTVTDNVLLPVSLQRRPTVRDHEQARQLIAQMGLTKQAGQRPRQLSGGQQSRVAIARALILEPPLLLLDEPFAALDAITREALQAELQATCRALNTAALFVTHDIAEAVFLADRVAVMDQGRICLDLPVALPRPRATALRHSPAFNALCAQLRQAMEQP